MYNLEFIIPTVIAACGSVVAVYGAILATILAIHEIRRNRPRVEVTASHGYIYNAGQPSEPVILMQATNVGSGSIPLNGVGWLNKDGSKQHITDPYPRGILPMDLEERHNCTTSYACRWFRENADHEKVVCLYFQDQTGNKWIGKVSEEDREQWLNSEGDGWQLG